MSKDNPQTGNRADVLKHVTDEPAAQRRNRVAQLIGRLLARTWLQRQERKNSVTSTNGPQAESRAN